MWPVITQPMLRLFWNAWLLGMALLCLLPSWMCCQRGGQPAVSGSGPRPLSPRRLRGLSQSCFYLCEGALRGEEGLDVAIRF